MSAFSRVTLCALFLSIFALSASAQRHAFPSPTAVPCTTCDELNNGRLIYPYPNPPIKAFRGRFVDSTNIKDWPLSPRTIRARGTLILPQRNRILMMLGSGVASYNLSTFFSTRIGQGMSDLLSRGDGATEHEKWLVPDSYWYAEMPGSGWQARSGDGQDRLYDIDADDRGFVYPACAVFGWGVLNDTAGLASASQVLDLNTLVPTDILSLRNGTKYYVLVSNFLAGNRAVLYDATNPAAPTLVLVTNFTPSGAWAKVTTPAGDNILGSLDGAGKLHIYTVEGLLSGTGPARTFHGSYNYVTSDGTNFYTVHGNAGSGARISIFSPSVVGSASTYSESELNTGESMTPLRVRHGRGYLTVMGIAAGGIDMRLFKMEGAIPARVDLFEYFKKFYVAPPSAEYVGRGGYVNPTDAIAYTDGSRDHIIFSAHGLGDVYELTGSGLPPQPIAPDPNIIVSGCARLEDPCSMSARSLSGASEGGWSCSWTFDGVGFANPTAGSCTIQPRIEVAKTIAIGVSVTNALGSGNATASLTVGPKAPPGDPTCLTAPPNFISVNLAGSSATCNNVGATCAVGETVSFFPGLFGGSFKDCDQFAWQFGDGTTATGRNVTHTFAANGVYTVRLTVSNTVGSSVASPAIVTIGAGGGGGGDPTCTTPPPNFISINLAGSSGSCNNVSASCVAGETVSFSPSLFGGSFKDCDQFTWTFGDGASATGRNVTHAFSSNGAYTVRLTVSNTAGSSVASPATVTIGGGQQVCPAPARFVSVNLIGISPNCNVAAGAICAPLEDINFSPSLFQGVINDCDTLSWDFGDGTSSALRNPVKRYTTTGAFRVQLTISNSTGSAVSSPQVVTVAAGSGAKPILNNLFIPAMIVAGTEVKFTADTSAPAITRSDWIFGDGTGTFISQGLSATHTYAVAGNYDIKVTVTNVFGTSDVMTINITVRPPPPPPTTRKRGSKR